MTGKENKMKTKINTSNIKNNSTLKRCALALGIFVLIAPVLSGCGKSNIGGYTVDAGNVAVSLNHFSGAIDSNVLKAGWHSQLPGAGTQIVEIPTYQKVYTMVRGDEEGAHKGDDSVVVNTASSNNLNVDCSISYHINYDPKNPKALIAFYNKYRSQFGSDEEFSQFEETQLRPAFRQAMVDAFGLKSTQDDLTGDGKKAAAAAALAQLNKRFNPDSIVIDEVRVRAVYPDAASLTSMRSNLVAEQNLRLSTLNQQLNTIVNQKSILAATAQAQAAHIRAASLTPRLVKFRHIKDLEIMGAPAGSLINFSTATKAEAAQP